MPSVPVGQTQIHPTAVVDSAAELGEGVSVGPHAVVEGGAVVGAGTRILANAIVTRHAVLGTGCELHFGAVVGHEPQDLAFRGGGGRAVVGDRTVIREYATVHRSTSESQDTQVGEDCLLMVQSHVAHDATVGKRVVICNSALVAGHTAVGDRAFLSGNTVIHQFCRLGSLVMLSGISAVGGDIGPYLLVVQRSEIAGINLVGMRRAGFKASELRRVREAYRLLFGAPTLEEGNELVAGLGLHLREIAAIHEFYSAIPRRGYSRPRAGAWLKREQRQGVPEDVQS